MRNLGGNEATTMSEEDKIYQIRTHMLYELRWMIYAANRFARNNCGEDYVAFIDSATTHGRNLFEFAYAGPKVRQFNLAALEAKRQPPGKWADWANNRVSHMMEREHDRIGWPEGLDNTMDDRFMKMAGAVLDRLEAGGATIPAGSIHDAFGEVVSTARAYWQDPSEATKRAVDQLRDGSRDSRPY